MYYYSINIEKIPLNEYMWSTKFKIVQLVQMIIINFRILN